MKRVVLGLGFATMASAGVFSVSAFHRDTTIRSNTVVAGIELGGLKPEEAQFKLRAWWEGERVKKLLLKDSHLTKGLPGMTPGQLGVSLDDAATVAQLPLEGLWDGLSPQQGDEQRYEVVFKNLPVDMAPLKKAVSDALPSPRPAQVLLVKGAIVRKPEVAGLELDESQLKPTVENALRQGEGTVRLPIREAEKKVTDEQLAEIKEVVESFSTRFPRNPNRNNNIRIAASKLNGVVIPPGAKMSFNETVGRRTIQDGFKVAGVYKNGRHDTGVGGGICQVSTTLYNASLISNLKIVRRENHSMPVAYVPLGRDATVDYGSHDLIIENNYETPIAISSEYRSGQLTFRILGKKVPGQRVVIERYGERSWSAPTKTQYDSSLPAGSKRVIEKGSSGRSINTTRVVYLNGKVVKREPLGRSYYAGGVRIVAVGPKRRPSPVVLPKTPVPDPATLTPTPTTEVSGQ